MINHDPHKNKVEIIHFLNKLKIIEINTIPKLNLIIMLKSCLHQMMKNIITKIINDTTQTKDLVLTVLINQIFLNHLHEMNKYDNLEILQHFTTIIFNNKIQSTPNHTNHFKCITKSHCHIIYNNMK